ncbi:MAG: transposase [Treponema sp.]|jgi:transposase|nr:transposase [Treponema sp.]
MEFISGESREQIIMLPDCIDDYIPDNNSARVIEAYISRSDLAALGCSRPEPNASGRPMYDPKDLLKSYLYGYMNRIRSSRQLETESKRNPEVLWLPGKLSPDHKTIAEFRRQNGEPLKQVFTGFVKLCVRLMLANDKMDVWCNVQTAVDAKHNLIAAFEVTSDGNGRNHLTPAATAAEENMEAEGLSAVADTGYDSVQDILVGMECV